MVLHWPLKRFVITASLIGMAGSAISIGLLVKAEKNVIQRPYCRQALQLLENSVAVDLIGKPIEIQRPDLVGKKQKFEALLTDIVIPFKGTKKSGDLHIEADRHEIEQEWSVKKLEVRFKDMADKLLIVYKRNDDQYKQNVSQSLSIDQKKLEW